MQIKLGPCGPENSRRREAASGDVGDLADVISATRIGGRLSGAYRQGDGLPAENIRPSLHHEALAS
jgi:hypothetical protein